MIRYIRLVAAVAVVATISAIMSREQTCLKRSSATPDSQITDLLSSVVVPELEFDEVSLENAVTLLNKHASAAGLNHGKPVFVLWTEGLPFPTGFRRLSSSEQADLQAAKARACPAQPIPGLSDLEDAEASLARSPIEPAKLSVSFRDVPLDAAARYIAGITDHRLEADAERILFIPSLVLRPPLVTKELYLEHPEITLDSLFAKLPDTRTDLRPSLEANHVVFTPGSYAYYEPKQAKLVLCFEDSEFDSVDAIFTSVTCGAAPAFSSAWERWKWRFAVRWSKITNYLWPDSGSSSP